MKTPAVLVGQAIGDALGMPFEHFSDGIHANLATWDGSFQPGTYHKLPAGHWTDDTEMAECLATSLLECEGFIGEDVARRYLAWSKATPHGMGGTTRSAMEQLDAGAPWQDSGILFDDRNKVGSGPAMRAAPLGMAFRAPETILTVCRQDAYITHASREATASSFAVAFAVRLTLEQSRNVLEEILSHLRDADLMSLVKDDLGHLGFLQALGKPPADIVPPLTRRGNARSIVATALYCALTCDTFQQGVIAAVKLGGDTDTRGAITGAILGARFGLEGIPDEYKRGLLKFEQLSELDRKLTLL